MNQPHRKYQMKFTIGADSYEDLLRATEQFVWFMEREYPDLDRNHNGALGSPDVGYSYDITYDADMTHERYHEELKAYLAEKCAAKQADA